MARKLNCKCGKLWQSVDSNIHEANFIMQLFGWHCQQNLQNETGSQVPGLVKT